MAKAIAKEYNIKVFEVLTGFKFIGEKIRQFQTENSYTYQFGFEESYGCLFGTYARDKDGIAAVMMLSEAAAYYKCNGITLWDQMLNIYKKYGYYKEETISITLEGVDGAKKIKNTLDKLRTTPLEKIGDFQVLEIRDYMKEKILNMKTQEQTDTKLPKSNVLYYVLENECWCCIRPSGTEPKIKVYIGSRGKDETEAEKNLINIKEGISTNL